MTNVLKIILAGSLIWLVGCSDSGHKDLQIFMEQARNKPVGEIEPLPTFQPYVTFKYSAVALRSPFDPPMQVLAQETIPGKSAVKPDESRKREYLEGFNFASLSMVGSLKKDNDIWALVNDGTGGIHRVKVGNYLGKNHGKIVSVTPSQVDITEIVPDGKGAWVERPRTLALTEK